MNHPPSEVKVATAESITASAVGLAWGFVQSIAEMRLRSCAGLMAMVMFWPSASIVRAQDESDEQTIHSMYRAGLGTSAAAYIIARRELAADDRQLAAKWTMLLMEGQARAALYQSNAEDSNAEDKLWQLCQGTYHDFIELDSDNPRKPWLQWQLARCDLLHAQADVARYLAAPANAQPRDQALERIRQILTLLESLEDDIAIEQPLAAREAFPTDGGTSRSRTQAMHAPAQQLAALSVDVGLLRCESLLLRTRLYPRGSADRIASATEVDQQTTAILQRTEPDWPSRAQLEVAAATARLALGQRADGLRQLEQLAISAGHRQARLRAALTAIEEIATTQPTAGLPPTASSAISRGHALLENLGANEAGPEIDLARLQLALAEVPRFSGDERQAAMERLIEQSRQLGQRYGSYWRSRADALLVGSIEATTLDGNSMPAQLVMVEVRQLLAAGDFTAAIERLLAHRDREAAAERGESALQSAAQAAALLARQQQWTSAADALVAVTCQFVSLPQASEAHRQAIYYLSQALREATKDSQLSSRYEALLKEQLILWPTASASDEAMQWLSSWLTLAGRRDELAGICLQRTIAASNSAQIERLFLDWLGEVLQLDTTLQVQQQISALNEARQRGDLAQAQSWSEAIQIVADVVGREATEAQMTAALRQLSRLEITASKESSAQQLLWAVRWLVTLREQRREQDIPPELLQWKIDSLPDTLRQGLARRFISAIDETPVAEHAAWAQRIGLDDHWRALLLKSSSPRTQAAGYRLLAWSADPTAGLEGLTKLAQQAGRTGGALQLELANALADSGPKGWEQSNSLAKSVVANSAANSELNWQARWRLVKNFRMLGQSVEAQQLAMLWLATAPAEAEVWKSRFSSVLSEGPSKE